MRALLLLAAAVCGSLPHAVQSSPTPEIVVDGIPHQALFAVDFDGQVGYAVGAGGEVQRTADGGATWVREQTPTPLALLGVAARGDRAIAVGQMGLVLVRDGEGRWQEFSSGSSERLFGVDIDTQGVAIAVGAFGALLRSSDGGKTWASTAPKWVGTFSDEAGRLGESFEPSLYGVQLGDDGKAWVVGELGLVLRSDDAGASWQVGHAGASHEKGVDPTLFGVSVRADGSGYAVGQEGYVLVSRDGGQSWSGIDRLTTANLLSVSSGSDGVVVATGMRDMLISHDDGQNWQSVVGEDIATGWYSGAARPGGTGTPYMVGNAGRILRLKL